MNNFSIFLRAIPFSTRGRKTTRKAVYKAFHKEFGLELGECLPTDVIADWRDSTPPALLESGKLFAEVMAEYFETQGPDRS